MATNELLVQLKGLQKPIKKVKNKSVFYPILIWILIAVIFLR